jgi:hypothetical protein
MEGQQNSVDENINMRLKSEANLFDHRYFSEVPGWIVF